MKSTIILSARGTFVDGVACTGHEAAVAHAIKLRLGLIKSK